jgi:hypothetical protein
MTFNVDVCRISIIDFQWCDKSLASCYLDHLSCKNLLSVSEDWLDLYHIRNHCYSERSPPCCNTWIVVQGVRYSHRVLPNLTHTIRINN